MLSEFVDHPRIRMLRRDGIGSLETVNTCRHKAVLRVIARMTKDKHEVASSVF